jgi:hypothetical protein
VSYTPQPGTIPWLVLNWLATQPPGTEVMTTPLALAIGKDPKVVFQSLQAALNAKLIFQRQKFQGVRAPYFWSLTDHSRPRAPVQQAETDLHLVLRVTPAKLEAILRLLRENGECDG